MRVLALKALDAYIQRNVTKPTCLYLNVEKNFTWRELFPDVIFDESTFWNTIVPQGFFVIGEKNYIQTERLPIVFSNERLELVYYYPF